MARNFTFSVTHLGLLGWSNHWCPTCSSNSPSPKQFSSHNSQWACGQWKTTNKQGCISTTWTKQEWKSSSNTSSSHRTSWLSLWAYHFSVMSSKNFTKTCLYLFVLILGEPRAETVGHRKSFNTRNNMQAKKILILLPPCHFISRFLIDLLAVMCLVTWPFNESEACVDLVICIIHTSLLFLC